MKVATFHIGGERRVGIVDEKRQSIAPFDLTVEQAHSGLLTLLARVKIPATLNPIPLREVTLEAPIPLPRRNNAHLHLSWNSAPDIDPNQRMPPEEHVLWTARMAKRVIDAGFTARRGAAAAKMRLDVERQSRSWC